MRRSRIAALMSAAAFAVGAKVANADTNLWVTQADFGGSAYAPTGTMPLAGQAYDYRNSGGFNADYNANASSPGSQPKETNWLGFGSYNSASTGNTGGTVYDTDTLGEEITYANTSLGGLSFTTNGLGNLDNYNPGTGTSHTADGSLGTSWAGLTTPTGSMIVDTYTGADQLETAGRNAGEAGGGYDQIFTGELINDGTGSTESPASTALISAIAQGQAIAIDFTAPGGGTTLVTDGNTNPYYTISFGTSDSVSAANPSKYAGLISQAEFGAGWANTTFTVSNKDPGTYNDDAGSFVVQHGTGATSYWTAYLPYSYAALSSATFAQFYVALNMNGFDAGNVTIDNIRVVSPTWANGTGAGNFSWTSTTTYPGSNDGGSFTYNLNVTEPTNWIGGFPGGQVGGASGALAQFEDLEGLPTTASGNTVTTTLDGTWTLGTLTYNTLSYQYTISPGSGGSLVMDNTINSAPAQINVVNGAGGIQSITAAMTLNSTTNVTVTNSTDTLSISGNVSGTGGLGMAGAGQLILSGSDSISGGLVNNGITKIYGNTTLGATGVSALTGTGTLDIGNGAHNVVHLAVGSGGATQGGLTIAGNSSLDIGNNHLILSDPGGTIDATIAAYLAEGYNGGGWNGVSSGEGSIITSASTGTAYGIGWADGATGGISGISSGQLEIKYTLYGDTNLDGVVTGVDFGNLAANFGKSGANIGWAQGAFTYNNSVTGVDFGLLAGNFGKSLGSAGDVVTAADWAALDAFAEANGLMSYVPEPASFGILALSGVAILARRRRRCQTG